MHPNLPEGSISAATESQGSSFTEQSSLAYPESQGSFVTEQSSSADPETPGSAATEGSSLADPNDAAIEYGFMLCRQMASRYRDHLVDHVTRYHFYKYMGGKEEDYVLIDAYSKNFGSLQVGRADWIGLDEFNLLFKNHSINKGIPLEEFVEQRNNVALESLLADQAPWKK
ncbi:uncharacterized protein LOC126838631 isoform X2 [Adelges cooleyi]|uniref:uncharacterized protein LOC126838631 isoform X2 n=1 Tax=Adelges cooleyi TaxID=133065 RepID=UPI0021800401|nr:uncharacterized protein LOC126838631 isoform X2 [Adelges cooleyi]